MQNFRYPYFSRDIAEFWRRWHISLSTWFRDYLYIPLGGSRGGKIFNIRNTFIIFLVSGLWHGANWTFVFWGLFHAILFIPLLIVGKNRIHLEFGNHLTFRNFWQMLTTFSFVCLAWIFFRANNLEAAFQFIGKIFSYSLFDFPQVYSSKVFILILFTLFIEWKGRHHPFPIERNLISESRVIRFGFYTFLIVSTYFLGNFDSAIEFIYFQF
jgi:D-alanyl-lipoteichoic acid acyltransferase DltB (MBOAT superfamily)